VTDYTDIAARIPQRQAGVSRLQFILALCLLDALSPALITIRYFGPNLVFLVNIFFLLMVCGIAATIRAQTKFPVVAVLAVLVFLAISVAKMFLLTTAGDYNQTTESAAKYFLSFMMPMVCFMGVYSLPEDDPEVIERALVDFARRYLYMVVPFVLFYAALNFSGRISYFGLGVNFHYVTPFFLRGAVPVVGFVILILLTGKRAVLLNFLIQTLVSFSRYLVLRPVHVMVGLATLVIISYAFQDNLLFLLRRFRLMYEVFLTLDLSQGLFSISNSWEALVLFGGRLEELTGILLYFEQHPGQIWFGAPPGANYIWSVESSDLLEFKNYSHFTWAGYTFRYGIVLTSALIVFLVTLLVRTANRSSGLWLVLLGILTSSFFGANMIVSPTTWVMIALATRYGRRLAQMDR